MRNPLLMTVNPNTNLDKKKFENFYKKINKKQKISRKDLRKAFKAYKAQHGRYPDIEDTKVTKTPKGINFPSAIEVGKVAEIIYDPPKKSRKKPFLYKHKMRDTKLYSSPDGRFLFLKGGTYMDNKDGWLKEI